MEFNEITVTWFQCFVAAFGIVVTTAIAYHIWTTRDEDDEY